MAISALPEPAPLTAPPRAPAGLSDAELVAEVRRGSDRAFEQLYERYHRRIAAYVFGMVNDYGRAEDIAQDVFISALRRMRDTDREIAFKPWIYEIAKNACIDQFRRTRRTEEVSFDAEEGLGAADYGRLVTTGPTPDVAVDQKVAIDHLRGAFGGLSETHHQILVMRELEGLSYREIGKRLGMSRPSVESTLFRARRRLGEEYEELVSGERCVRIQGIIGSAVAVLPGARDQRRLAAHLSHCQACRRHAVLAGLDTGLLVAARSSRAKIAAFLPLPGFVRRRWFPGGEEVAPVANHHVSTLAQYSVQAGTLDPSVYSWGKAAVAAVTLAFAGVAGAAAKAPAAAPKPAASRAPRVVTPSRSKPASSPGTPKPRPQAAPAAKQGSTTASAGQPAPPAPPTRPSGLTSVPAATPPAVAAPANPIAKALDPASYPAPPARPAPAPDPVVPPALEEATDAVGGAADAQLQESARAALAGLLGG